MKKLELYIIEDNFIDIELLQETLKTIAEERKIEYNSVVANTLSEALEKLSVADPEATVLLDLGLPDSKGLNTLSALQSAYPALEYIVVSNSIDPVVKHEVEKKGCTFVQKDEVITNIELLLQV